MRSFFINRQYPAAIVDHAMNKALSIDRIIALTPKTRAASDRIPFTITFHPVNNSIKPIVNRNFNILNSDSSTSNILLLWKDCSSNRDHNRKQCWIVIVSYVSFQFLLFSESSFNSLLVCWKNVFKQTKNWPSNCWRTICQIGDRRRACLWLWQQNMRNM